MFQTIFVILIMIISNGSLNNIYGQNNKSFNLTVSILQTDREILISLYNNTGGDNWTDNSGWKTPPLHTDGFSLPGTENSWYGIVISNNSISRITLANNNLTGTLPSQIGNLINLTSIGLSNNDLSGSIPSEIGNLSNLTFLNLSSNNFSSSIPENIGALTSLVLLDLSTNNLSGQIPEEIGNITNLSFLSLGYNNLSGTIPSELGNLSNLTDMSLLFNSLTGSLPVEICNLSKLSILYLSHNSLSGNIPKEIENLAELSLLGLSNNQFDGAIPVELTNLSNLSDLYLELNNFSGNIPVEIANMNNLETLDLAHNELIGSIPLGICELQNLRYLNLKANCLTDTIPSELVNLTKLTFLDLSSNKLTGIIPGEFVNFSSLPNGSLLFDYNGLFTLDEDLISFLDTNNPDWEKTQTIPPSGLTITQITTSSIKLKWLPIQYVSHPGGYLIYQSETEGGTYSYIGMTSKKENTIQIINVPPNGIQFHYVVKSFTSPHQFNSNKIESEFSDEAIIILDETSNINSINSPHKVFQLDQNYPNPFNPSTVFRYTIPTGFDLQYSLHVTLHVYDLLGNQIATLQDAPQSPGRYERVWNADDQPSGIYISVLRYGNMVNSKKMLLLK